MGRCNKIFQILAIISVAFYIQFLPLSIFAYDFEDCDSCHDTTLDQDVQNPYLHFPFIEKQCVDCHATEAESHYSQENQKTDWLSKSAPVGNTHVFRFPDNELGEILIIDLRGKSGQTTLHEFKVPSFKELIEFEDSGIPPNPSNVKLISINQDIYITATVGWDTDTLTNAIVYYGEKDLSQKSDLISQFSRHHQVVLRNLAKNKTYRFSAISTDLFGRRQESKPITFSTSVISSTKQPDKIDVKPHLNSSDKIAVHFHRIEDDYVIEVFLTQSTPFFLGTKGRKEPCLPEDEFHEGLSCIEVSSMQACLNCHNKHDHPFNVVPRKKGIIIPKDFPTFFGGKIVCTSCHHPHSSQNSYLTRRDSSKSLCTSCHRAWIK